MTRRPPRWPGTGPPPIAPLRNCRPGCTRPRPRSGCSATPRPRGTGSEPSSCLDGCPSRSTSPASTCRSCTCAASTRSTQPATRTFWRRACRGGLPPLRRAIPTRRSPRPYTCASRGPDGTGSPADARPLLEQALRLFEQAAPSADHAETWLAYGEALFLAEGQGDARRAALARALDVAEAAGATGVAARIQRACARRVLRGEVAEGLAILKRARVQAEASGDGEALWRSRLDESDILLRPAVRPGRRGGAARPAGRPPGGRRPTRRR